MKVALLLLAFLFGVVISQSQYYLAYYGQTNCQGNPFYYGLQEKTGCFSALDGSAASSLYSSGTLTYYKNVANCSGTPTWTASSMCANASPTYSVQLVNQVPEGQYVLETIYPDQTCSGGAFLALNLGIPTDQLFYPLNACIFYASSNTSQTYTQVNSTALAITNGISCSSSSNQTTSYFPLECFQGSGTLFWINVNVVTISPSPTTTSSESAPCNSTAVTSGTIVMMPIYLPLLSLLLFFFF